MRYKKAVIGMMAVCAVLGGCQKADEEPKTATASEPVSQEKSEDTMDFSTMKNGDRIQRSITDEVKMDAELVLPEKDLDSVEIYHVLVDTYDGPKVMEDLLGYIPEAHEKPSVQWKNIRFTVLTMEENWISRIKAEILPEQEAVEQSEKE